jgi:hypothetical protein
VSLPIIKEYMVRPSGDKHESEAVKPLEGKDDRGLGTMLSFTGAGDENSDSTTNRGIFHNKYRIEAVCYTVQRFRYKPVHRRIIIAMRPHQPAGRRRFHLLHTYVRTCILRNTDASRWHVNCPARKASFFLAMEVLLAKCVLPLKRTSIIQSNQAS